MLKRNENNILSNQMAISLQSNRKRSFWQEVKHISGKSMSVVNITDPVNGSDQISNLFACIYKVLYIPRYHMTPAK